MIARTEQKVKSRVFTITKTEMKAFDKNCGSPLFSNITLITWLVSKLLYNKVYSSPLPNCRKEKIKFKI